MEEKKTSHKRCYIGECTKQAWKKGMCYKHFHATGGQDNPAKAKKQGGRTVSRVAHNHEKAGSIPVPATKPDNKISSGKSVTVTLELLRMQKADLEREAAEIDTAIRTIEKYA